MCKPCSWDRIPPAERQEERITTTQTLLGTLVVLELSIFGIKPLLSIYLSPNVAASLCCMLAGGFGPKVLSKAKFCADTQSQEKHKPLALAC